jgi:TonB family protein
MRLTEAGILKRREQRWNRSFNAFDPAVQSLALDEERDNRRRLRLGIVLAALLHLALFAVVFPTFEHQPRRTTAQRRVYRIQQVRFQPPQPQVRAAVPKPRARRIPIPDPTPDDPEPLFEETTELPRADFPALDFGVAIPDGPPGPGHQVYQLTGDITAPVRTHAPRPVYSEEARRGQIQGVVILQTIIDTLGNVRDIRVLKGLPSGLTEAAVKAVSGWRFEPALLDGQPVPVHYMVTVSFSLQ